MSLKALNNVWVVDDDPLQVLILNRLLADQPNIKNIKFFSGGDAAVAALKGKISSNELPDLVFLDLVMMRGDGWAFLDHYKKLKGKLGLQAHIVVISSYSEDNLKKAKQYAEVVDFLPKPLDKKEFEALMKLLDEKEE
ncbi:MAG TPA: response regulator [Ohtaekwangia sp.]|nr:response regulator [Ohtaekwangia sp.]